MDSAFGDLSSVNFLGSPHLFFQEIPQEVTIRVRPDIRYSRVAIKVGHDIGCRITQAAISVRADVLVQRPITLVLMMINS